MLNLRNHLKLAYTFEGTYQDISGNGNHGVPENVSFAYGIINKMHGRCIFMESGSPSGVSTPFDFASATFTISLWVYPISFNPGDFEILVQTLEGWVGTPAIHTDSNASGALYCGVDPSSRFTPTDLPAGTLELNKWNFLVYSCDFTNGVQKFYKNGVLIAQKTGLFSSVTNWENAIIGAPVNFIQFYGYVDNFFVFDIVLSQPDVQRVMFNFLPLSS